MGTSIIVDRPVIFGADGKVQRIASGGTIEAGTLRGVDDLTITPGYAGYLHAITRDGYLSIDGYSTSAYLGLNDVVGLSLRTTTPATVGSPHKNPPIIDAVGQYFIGGTSVTRSLGSLGMLVTAVDGGGEVTDYSLAWADNSNNQKWKVNSLGSVSQDGDLTFNPTYSATIQDVKRINGSIGSSLLVGYDALDKIEITATDVNLLSDDGNSYVQVTDVGNVYARTDASHNITFSNEAVALGTYPAITTSWNAPVVSGGEYDAVSFLLKSSDADGTKAPRMYFLNELTYNSADYDPDGGDITIKTNIKASVGLGTVFADGGNINILTEIERGNLTNSDAGKILLDSANLSHGILDYGLQLKAAGSVRVLLGDQNEATAIDSSFFTIKKDVELTTSGVRMLSLHATDPSDYVEVLIASNLNTSTPAAIGSLALDTNGGKVWVMTGAIWEQLATVSSYGRADSLIVPVPFDVLTPPEYGDVVIFADIMDGYGSVTPALANWQVPNIQGIATADLDFIQVAGIATVKIETAILEGEEVYLSDVDIGTITNIPPDNPGSSVVSIGNAVDDSNGNYCRVLLNIKEPVYIPE